jgi:hypothetical protein
MFAKFHGQGQSYVALSNDGNFYGMLMGGNQDGMVKASPFQSQCVTSVQCKSTKMDVDEGMIFRIQVAGFGEL